MRAWQRHLTPGGQRVAAIAPALASCTLVAVGVQLFLAFDREHAHFAYAMMFGGAVMAVVGSGMIVWPVPRAVFGQLEAMPGAAHGAAKVRRDMAWQTLFTLVHNSIFVALAVDFVFSDLTDRGGSGLTSSQQWGFVWTLVWFWLCGNYSALAHFACRDINSAVQFKMMLPGESALQVLLAATTRLANDVDAGLPVADLERRLVGMREVMAQLWSAVAVSLGMLVGISLVIILTFVVCVVEPNPPAWYIYDAVALCPALFMLPLTAARIQAQMRRIPIALSVRACKAGYGDSNGDGLDVEAPGQGASGAAAATRPGFEMEVRSAFHEQRGPLRQLQLDLLLTRMDKMRLGWYILDVPVTSALMTRLRAVAAAIMLVIMRESDILSF